MAKTHSGDWRNPDRIRAWAEDLATELPRATPGTPVDHPARSVRRLLGYGVVGWALSAAIMGALYFAAGLTASLIVHAIAAPLLFIALARRYFGARGARDALPTAIVWTCVMMLLDLIVIAGVVQRSLAMFGSVAATWLPYALVFLATWATGALMATMPWSEGPKEQEHAPHPPPDQERPR
jgi:hypothetical protein